MVIVPSGQFGHGNLLEASTHGFYSMINAPKTMIKIAKRLVLRSLCNAGYVLLKRQEYEDLLGRAAQAAPLERPSAPTDAVADPDRRRILKDAKEPFKLPPARMQAVYAAVRNITRAGIEGDIVDCGDGSTQTLTFIAAVLMYLGDTSHRLVLFDTTADPLHRAEPKL